MAKEQTLVQAPGAPGAPAGGVPGAPAGPPAQKFVDDRTDFTPRMTVKPESAPAYDSLRVPKVMPIVSAAVCSKRGCKCYTQQGTDAGLDDAMCRAWDKGRPFNPYTDPTAEPARGRAVEAVAGGGVGGSGRVDVLPGTGYGVVGSRREALREPGRDSGQSAAQAPPARS